MKVCIADIFYFLKKTLSYESDYDILETALFEIFPNLFSISNQFLFAIVLSLKIIYQYPNSI